MAKKVLTKDMWEFKDTNGHCYPYYFIPYHHMQHPSDDKSIWTINRDDEFLLFEASYVLDKFARSTFNLLIANGEAQPIGLGKNGSGEIKLFLCRFINERSEQGTPWHGYPINHMDQNRERPLTDFYESGPGSLLCPHDLKRLKRGKPLL